MSDDVPTLEPLKPIAKCGKCGKQLYPGMSYLSDCPEGPAAINRQYAAVGGYSPPRAENYACPMRGNEWHQAQYNPGYRPAQQGPKA